MLLIDLLLGALALMVLVVTGLTFWRRVKGLSRSLRSATARVEAASTALSDRPTT